MTTVSWDEMQSGLWFTTLLEQGISGHAVELMYVSFAVLSVSRITIVEGPFVLPSGCKHA